MWGEFETTSVGAFLLASMGLKRYASLADASQVVKVRNRILPDPKRGRHYRELVSFYKDLYTASRPLFEKRQALMSLLQDNQSVSIENL